MIIPLPVLLACGICPIGVGAGLSCVNHGCFNAAAADIRRAGSSPNSPFIRSKPCALIEACPLQELQNARRAERDEAKGLVLTGHVGYPGSLFLITPKQ